MSAVADRLADMAARARDVLAEDVSAVELGAGEVVIRAHAETEDMITLFERLRDDDRLDLSMLCDLTAVDRLGARNRFEIVYQLRSPECGHTVRVRLPVGDGTGLLASLAPVHPVAAWLEREVEGLFGIRFGDLADDGRSVLEPDFASHPLRKDHPGMGESAHRERRR